MYVLLGIDTILRIAAAMLFLFVVVPALARRRPADLDPLAWFWWCLAAGITALTLLGQVLTLLNIFSTVTLLLAIALLILVTRAHRSGRPMTDLLRDLNRNVILFSLNTLESRVNVRRRIRRLARSMRRRMRIRPAFIAWSALIVVAFAFRLIRPFATPNLGFSDSYAHLYLLRLLQQGLQVDPAWGPYPRGMHFLLLAIHELTNADEILLMNFFGAFAGVLMTLAVADTARRLSSLRAGLVAGLLFATMIGGAKQYPLFGGSVATRNAEEGRAFVQLKYDEVPPTEGEFDVLLTVFQRQTGTLPQELAIVFLFPAAMFLMRRRLSGYFFCTSAIAAVHPGVLVPLILLSLVTVIATRRDFLRAALTGAAGVALGSTWMLAFIKYRSLGGGGDASGPGAGAMYYFPFLRQGEDARIVTWVAITPFLIACAVIAVILLVRGVVKREERLLFPALATFIFLFTHVASRYGLPELVEVRRNSAWLAMTLAILVAVAVMELRWSNAIAVAILVPWLWLVPLRGANDAIINYSGYRTAAYAVLEIQRRLEPFTWTIVTYGQEFPMVLGKGFHLPAADFLDKYDPAQPSLPIPTKYVFIIVEKTPHRFEINSWKSSFSRTNLEQRLQTWCFLYQMSHRDIRVWMDDEHVRVYAIERSDAEVQRIARGDA